MRTQDRNKPSFIQLDRCRISSLRNSVILGWILGGLTVGVTPTGRKGAHCRDKRENRRLEKAIISSRLCVASNTPYCSSCERVYIKMMPSHRRHIHAWCYFVSSITSTHQELCWRWFVHQNRQMMKMRMMVPSAANGPYCGYVSPSSN